MKKQRAVGVFVMLLSVAAMSQAENLYDEKNFRALASDHRAFRVGDNLTVIVTEFASATTSANTRTDKEGSAGASWNNTTQSHQGSATLSEDFTGGGRIERSGKLIGQLTVIVEEVAANGDLTVRGIQEIEVNNERQRLLVVGRVKPQDVSANNTLPSNRLADAKISFTGKGLLAEKQDPGLISRFLSWLGLL